MIFIKKKLHVENLNFPPIKWVKREEERGESYILLIQFNRMEARSQNIKLLWMIDTLRNMMDSPETPIFSYTKETDPPQPIKQL